MDTIYLDYNLLETPFAAIHMAKKELARMAQVSSEMVIETKKAFLGNDRGAAEIVFKKELIVNNLRDKITKYLSSILAAESVTEHQAETISGLFHVVSDVEHIGDHCKDIARFAVEKIERGYEFSEKACAEIYQCFEQGTKMVNEAIEALSTGDFELAKNIKREEVRMNKLEANLRIKHMERLNRRECSPEFTVIYTDVVHYIEKIGDCCDNIANKVLDDINFKETEEKNK